MRFLQLVLKTLGIVYDLTVVFSKGLLFFSIYPTRTVDVDRLHALAMFHECSLVEHVIDCHLLLYVDDITLYAAYHLNR